MTHVELNYLDDGISFIAYEYAMKQICFITV